MEQFIKNFAGDVKDAEHRTKRGRLQMPPPAPGAKKRVRSVEHRLCTSVLDYRVIDRYPVN